MDHLQQIVNDLFNIHLYDNLINLLSEYLPSKHAENIIYKIDKIFGNYVHQLWDIPDSYEGTHAIIPIKFVELDWKILFIDMWNFLDGLYDPVCNIDRCCTCQIIPEQIRICRECNCYRTDHTYRYKDDLPRVCYTCPRCKFENSVVIADFDISETVILNSEFNGEGLNLNIL